MTITYPHLSTTGRLGNQLWEIASTIGIAAREDDVALFPEWDYQPFFCVPEELFVDQGPGPRGSERMKRDAITLVPHMDHRAAPYLQDYGLFREVENQIKSFFQPSARAIDVLTEEWNFHFAELTEPLISVHVRRGDNVTHPEGFHPLRSMEYYRSALEAINEPDGNIVVFSDDAEWCRENFEREVGCEVAVFYDGVARPREYVDRQLYTDAPILDWIDLQLMAACDRHVISNSTYAWWGAFLSQDPEPIKPSNWFGREISPWTDASLMFPEHWLEVYDPTMGGV